MKKSYKSAKAEKRSELVQQIVSSLVIFTLKNFLAQLNTMFEGNQVVTRVILHNAREFMRFHLKQQVFELRDAKRSKSAQLLLDTIKTQLGDVEKAFQDALADQLCFVLIRQRAAESDTSFLIIDVQSYMHFRASPRAPEHLRSVTSFPEQLSVVPPLEMYAGRPNDGVLELAFRNEAEIRADRVSLVLSRLNAAIAATDLQEKAELRQNAVVHLNEKISGKTLSEIIFTDFTEVVGANVEAFRLVYPSLSLETKVRIPPELVKTLGAPETVPLIETAASAEGEQFNEAETSSQGG